MRILIIVLFFIAWGCKPSRVKVTEYVSVDSLITDLEKNNSFSSIIEHCYINGKVEKKKMDSTHFKKIAQVIKSFDLNKPAYINAFKEIRTFKKDTLKIIYAATTGNSKVRKLTLRFYKNKFIELEGIMFTTNNLYTLTKRVTLKAATGYQLVQIQQQRFSDQQILVLIGNKVHSTY